MPDDKSGWISCDACPAKAKTVIKVPFLVIFLYLYLRHWYLVVPAVAVLVSVAFAVPDLAREWRWAAMAGAAMLAVPLLLGGTIMVIGEMSSAMRLVALERTLDREETIAGLPLPAGSTVHFHDTSHTKIGSVELPGVAEIRGMSLRGMLDWNDSSQLWSATLAHDQHVEAWPCRAGAVEFDKTGLVQRCVLSKAHELLGLALPAGTTITRGNGDEPWRLMLPPGDIEVALPALATTAPAGVTLFVASDGRLVSINSGHGQTIVVRGVPLDSMNLFIRGDRVVAALARPFKISGTIQTAGTGIRIDLLTGEIRVAEGNWWLSP
jgi:hypothetical protein